MAAPHSKLRRNASITGARRIKEPFPAVNESVEPANGSPGSQIGCERCPDGDSDVETASRATEISLLPPATVAIHLILHLFTARFFLLSLEFFKEWSTRKSNWVPLLCNSHGCQNKKHVRYLKNAHLRFWGKRNRRSRLWQLTELCLPHSLWFRIGRDLFELVKHLLAGRGGLSFG